MNTQLLWQMALKNWKTTLGGILAAIPSLVAAAGFTLSANGQHWLALCGGVGALLLGMAAKDSTTHSTEAEVEAATNGSELKKAA